MGWCKKSDWEWHTLATFTVDGQPTPVKITARYFPEWPPGMRWSVEAVTSDERVIARVGDCPVKSLQAAKAAARSMINGQWTLQGDLGYCWQKR